MTVIETITLIGLVVILAAGIGYYMTKGQPSLKEMKEEPKKDIAKYPSIKTLTESAKELAKEIDKVSKVPTTQEESQQLAKDLVEIATATPKKKRKYYPKKK